jgi:2-polyprenyl-3-methyl-5-hydroxy-6-metoxy-1,4-benzoquinol methylase
MLNEHWQEVYSSKKADEVSWFQRKPEVSLRLVTAHAALSDAVIDVGAGQSLLIDALLDDGFTDVTVMDISEVAVSEVRQRVHGQVSASFVVADVRSWVPSKRFDLWHDRAVFHFMKSVEDKAAYLSAIAQAIRPGGIAIIGTFAEDGPTQCSGLDVSRYSPIQLANEFEEFFALESTESEEHVTPWGAVQHFTWVTLRRKQR